MEKLISIKPNAQIISLFNEIQDFLGESNRTEIFRMAVGKAYNEEVDWNKIVKKERKIGTIDKIPESLTLRIDEERLEVIISKIKVALGVQRLQMKYLIRAILYNFIFWLEEGEEEKKRIKTELEVKKCEQVEDLSREKFIFNKKIAILLADNSEYSIKKFIKLRDFLDELENSKNDS